MCALPIYFESAILEEGHRVELEVLPILIENAQCYVRRRSERHAGIWQGHGARFAAPLDCELYRTDGNVSLLCSLARDQAGCAGSLERREARVGPLRLLGWGGVERLRLAG